MPVFVPVSVKLTAVPSLLIEYSFKLTPSCGVSFTLKVNLTPLGAVRSEERRVGKECSR